MPFFLAAWTLFFRALIRIHHYRKTLGSVKHNQTATTNAQMFRYFYEDVDTAWITAIRDAADTLVSTRFRAGQFMVKKNLETKFNSPINILLLIAVRFSCFSSNLGAIAAGYSGILAQHGFAVCLLQHRVIVRTQRTSFLKTQSIQIYQKWVKNYYKIIPKIILIFLRI